MLEALSAFIAAIMIFCSNTYLKHINPKTAEAPKEFVSDTKPHKYFTLSFDDGITQDYKIMEICKKYNFRGVTFNINTGLCGENWDWVAEAIKAPGTTHIRLTEEEIKNGAYDGFDLAVHTLKHNSVKSQDDNPLGVYNQIMPDAMNIYKWTGTYPLGMAYPGVDNAFSDKSAENILKYTTIRYARGTTSTYKFGLPERFLVWQPTCSIVESNVLTLAEEFLKADCKEDMLFYCWGHGYELDAFKKYETLEQLIKMMSEDDSVVCVSNTEFYQLFKDKIDS